MVINTIGNYAETATTIARACMPGGHYVDLAADLTAVPRLLALHHDAAAADSTLVTGSGFGVLASEAVVVKLCEDQPTAAAVRVDALASVASEGGVLGAAYAASIVDAIAEGGRAYGGGRLGKTAGPMTSTSVSNRARVAASAAQDQEPMRSLVRAEPSSSTTPSAAYGATCAAGRSRTISPRHGQA